ncbi:MAG TPA: hypothetical protein VE057_03395 [Archangium sp.]|nr:hypothetical protein [Archangium sp.]
MHAFLRLALALFLLAAPVALAQTKDPEGPPRCLTVPMADGIYTDPKANQTGLVVVEGCVAAFGASCVNTSRLEVQKDRIELRCSGGRGYDEEDEPLSYRASKGALLLQGVKKSRLERQPLPADTLVERLRSPDERVVGAAIERALARQTEPEVCTALGALVKDASVLLPKPDEAGVPENVLRVIAGTQAPCLQAALRESLSSGGRLADASLEQLSKVTEDSSQQLQDLLRFIDSSRFPGLTTLPARSHPMLVAELSARVTRGTPPPVALASAHLLGSLTWDRKTLGGELLALAAGSSSCEVRMALLSGYYMEAGSAGELVTLYRPLLSSEGRAKAQGNPKHCTRAHALAAYNLAWRLKELEESAPQAWELIISSLQGPETEATRERVSAIVFGHSSICVRRPASAPPEVIEKLLTVLRGKPHC